MTTEKNNRANTSLMEGTNLTEEGKSREGEAKLSEEMRKMRNEELYSFADASVEDSLVRAYRLCSRLQTMSPWDTGYRAVMEQLIPGLPASSMICPPFYCDHGHGMKIGENVFINRGGTMLDGGTITIGAHTKLGPNCRLVTPNHPVNYLERRKPVETCFPISIGCDCWLGAGVVVCPGVKIGNRCVIGAGSVVVKDIPDDSLAVGNPARVVKRLLNFEC